MCEGWIKSYRSILEWEWWGDHNTTILWIYLLHAVNYEPKKWQGKVIEPGQLVTSLGHLAEQTGLSIRSIRTSLDKLNLTGEIEKKTTSRYTLVTVRNWEKFQDKATNKRQTNDKQTTTTKEVKKERNKDIKTYGQNFDQFWEQYPRKISKEQARKTWNKLHLEHDLDLILEGLERAKKYDSRFRDKQYTPHASTWLNARGWEDNFTETAAMDYLEIIKNGTNSAKVQGALIKWAKMRQARDGLLTEDTIALALEQVRQLANTEDEAVAIINQSTIAGWPMFYKRKE